MTEASDLYIAQLERDKAVAEELIALILNETGPVEIDRHDRVKLPENAEIVVDINPESETVTISLGVRNAEQ